tara:strand:+ start:1478 stop:2635 length:1158 start_codon:yes stop_codon:yes gene_type:complete
MPQASIWDGSSTFTTGSTPFGFYDTDSDFQTEADNFAKWCAKRLGYPIMDVELNSGSFYAILEESITEYSAQVNQYNIKDNLLSLQGQSTGSNLTHRNVTQTFGRTIQISEQYGTEALVGGTTDLKHGSIQINSGSQEYDLNTLWADVSESGEAIEVRRVFHEAAPSIQRYFDPYAGTGQGTINMLDGFGFGNYSPAVTFLMMPIYADLLRVQAIEFNDMIRKSAYSFELVNNKLKIFPNPTGDDTIHFQYMVKSEKDSSLKAPHGGSTLGVVSDVSNAPYENMVYTQINDVGKQWIRKYGLALAKELLGMIRSKYSSVPIPNAEVNLDGDTLRSEANAEKEQLITQLREYLDQSSRRSLMEAERDESEYLQDKLGRIPINIYVG